MKRLFLLITAVLLVASPCLAERVSVGDGGDDLAVRLLESSDQRIRLEFEIGGFEKYLVEIDGEPYYRILLGGESNYLEAGLPDLPNICRSVVIPDDAKMKISVLSSEFEEIAGLPVAPSKGNLKRNVNPEEIAFTFGSFYDGVDAWPAEMVTSRAPYILRDYRGLTVVVNPFQYDPATQTLKVYTRMIVELVPDGPGEVNVLTRHHRDSIDPEFSRIYIDHFANYTEQRYTSVGEAGGMLVITYDAFNSTMQPFVDWKNQMGVKTTMVDVSAIGNNSTSIKDYIQDYYDTTNLAYVLLVGDATELAYPTASGGASDPTYALLAGSDSYPDIFVGRFSAQTASQAQTQVDRSVDYEKYPAAGGAWYHKGMGVASNQGPGDDNEYDNVHIDNIRADLLGFTYTEVDQIYDPSGTSAQVTSGLNNGRSIINYCGHGSTTSWSSTGFSNTHINALTNDDMLPFIVSVACVNGAFTSTTCFAEAWMRATNGSNPTGAIGIYASSINQDWNPPMAAQDECADLLVADQKRTFGGICFNGSCLMMDEYGSAGVNMYNTWHVFGDPSLRVRTDTPASLTVNHDGTVEQTASSFTVDVPGVAGALCGLYYNGTYHGSAFTNVSGTAVITVEGTLPDNQDIDLTVTYFNSMPYFSTVHVGPALYPTCDVNPLEFNVSMGPDETRTEYLTIANNGDVGSVLNYSIEIVDGIPVRNITGSTFVSDLAEYTAGTTFDIVFTITCQSNDNEWIKYASLDFPSGVTVNSSTDFPVEGTSRVMYTDGSSGNGALVSWAGTDTYGSIYPGESALATVNVTVGAFTGDMSIPYTLGGDLWGSEPHNLSGTIVLTASGPSIVLNSPNGGEVWGIDEIHNITWNSSGGIGDIEIVYSVDNGSAWLPVSAGTTDDGQFEWTVPVPKSDLCLVKVAGLSETVEDQSDAVFSIYQPVYWLEAVPNNGAVNDGDNDIVELRFDTAGMADGEYYATVIVHNNAGSSVDVPVILTVSSTTVDPNMTTVEANDDLFLNPDGSGDSTLTVVVTARDGAGDPIPGIPAGGVIVDLAGTSSLGESFLFCESGSGALQMVSTLPTDASGQVTLMVTNAGGCGTVAVTAEVQGVAIIDNDVANVRSTDFTGDGVVNFLDTYYYISALNTGTGYCGNFNGSADGIVNFLDTVKYLPALANSITCP